ncbi:hypothetical protein HK105_204855 [Polyrhizophydium stewartii]|uniref:Glutamine amidotransferase domain-containing protein n=1 Tax=Polyrhizophydium stewartii TaxID=2732419 RepID=A0ABR4N817_9FUNG
MPAIADRFGQFPAIFERLFAAAADRAGDQLSMDTYFAIDGQLPANPSEYDAIVISGSRYSAYEDLPWINSLKDFVRKVDAEASAKVVGVCFGHQIIAEALGGKVVQNEKGWEIGPTTIDLTESGAKLLGVEARQIALHEMHKDHVVQMPEGFEAVGSTAKSTVQIMRKGNKIISVQAHPEFVAGITRELLDSRRNLFSAADYDLWISKVDDRTDGDAFASAVLRFVQDVPVRAQTVGSFVAHSSRTTCLRIGPKSGRVIVTGGEDRKVNLWTVGRSSAVLSLSGHSSSVECVALDWPEELVVAGAASGTLKLWDLEHAKVIRTLAGHKSSAMCVQFHPFGEFFASGSSDCSVRLWDVRRKGCIQTYNGHAGTVRRLEITPDGRWIASSGEDNTVKIWDMTAGKLLHTIADHSDFASALAFSPTELVLATASHDRRIRVYDLQNFACVATSSLLSDQPTQLVFASDGECIYSSSSSTFDSWQWDQPDAAVHCAAVGWTNIVDFGLLGDVGRVVACGVEQNFVEVWAMDLFSAQNASGDERVAASSHHLVPRVPSIDRKSTHLNSFDSIPESATAAQSQFAQKDKAKLTLRSSTQAGLVASSH